MSRTITLGVIHLTHQPCSYLGAPICRGLVIKFTSTLLKPAGDLKPARNLTGAGVGASFHPWVWPLADLDGCREFGRGRIFVKPASLPSLKLMNMARNIRFTLHYTQILVLIIFILQATSKNSISESKI
jgi:hypothetical protein